MDQKKLHDHGSSIILRLPFFDWFACVSWPSAMTLRSSKRQKRIRKKIYSVLANLLAFNVRHIENLRILFASQNLR